MRKVILSMVVVGLLLSLPCQNLSGNHQIVLQNTNIVDVVKGTIRKNMDIVLNGKRISDIVKHKTDWNNEDLKPIDLTGQYAIPGLIEGHAHISGIPEKCLIFALKKGVTALRDMGGDGAYLKELQDAVHSGELSAPDIYFSALMGGRDLIMEDSRAKLSTPPSYALGEAPWMRLVEDTSNIEQIVKEAKICGATGIKMYSHLTADLCKRLSVEAKRQNLKVWAHAVVYPATLEDVIGAGVEVISHVNGLLYKKDWELKRDGSLALDPSLLDSKRLKGIFKTMKDKNVRLDPTLVIANTQISRIKDNKKAEELKKLMYEAVKAAYDYGIKIAAGTDYPRLVGAREETLMLHREIEILVNGVGLPAIEALRAATINNAEILGIDGTHGTIEVGKIADIVVLKNNPLEDINYIEQVSMVIKNGKIIK